MAHDTMQLIKRAIHIKDMEFDASNWYQVPEGYNTTAIIVRTGSAWLQTTATPAELRQLALNLVEIAEIAEKRTAQADTARAADTEPAKEA